MSLNPFPATDLRPELALMYFCTCADIIVTKAAENGVARPKRQRLYRKMAALNSSMTSDFKLEVVTWSKPRMCNLLCIEQLPK